MKYKDLSDNSNNRVSEIMLDDETLKELKDA